MLPKGQLRQVDDAYVLVMLDQPEQTARAIGEFLRADALSGPRRSHHTLTLNTHKRYRPSGAAMPPTIPLPEFSGPVRVRTPKTAPALAITPTTATHADHSGKTLDSQVNTAMATKNVAPANAAGAASRNAAVCNAYVLAGSTSTSEASRDVEAQCDVERGHEHQCTAEHYPGDGAGSRDGSHQFDKSSEEHQ